jgi:hypothetical protein
MRTLLLLLAVLLGAPMAVHSQSLVVKRADGTERTLNASALSSLPRARGLTLDHGDTLRYEGWLLKDVLRAAEAGPVDSLRGPALRRLIWFVGRDGYRIVMTLAELDVTLGNTSVVVVDRQNSAPLTDEVGPLRILVVGDSRASRWVRQVSRIELVDF